jgi:hypothetical protein
MTTSGKMDAAVLARQENDELTEIAQIGPGDSAKARELLVNENLPPGLLAAFEAAASAAQYTQKLETFRLQQQEKDVSQQRQAEEKKEKEQRENWLESMSPEYQQAYSHLMTTVDTADKEYDQLRERLKQRGKALDQEAQEIDDKAIHLSDNSRAYVNAEGVLVDKNGVPLKGQAAAEATSLQKQRNGDVSTLAIYQQNQQARTEVDTLSRRVDTEQKAADEFGQDTKDGKHKDTDEVKRGDEAIEKRLKATSSEAGALLDHDTKAVAPSLVDLSDLDGDSVQSKAPADRSSFANKVDDKAGIKANSVSVSFNAVTQGTDTASPSPLLSQKPAVAAPVPS